MKISLCPCQSKKAYTLCCGPFHKGNIHAPTAEALMRSRYSAYVINDARYVFKTWDKGTRPPLKILREDTPQVFTHLKILSSSDGGQTDDFGTVEFIASYTMNDSHRSDNKDNNIQQHHENSYFVKQKNRWVYVDEVSKVKELKNGNM